MISRQTAARTKPIGLSSDRWLFGYADIVTLLFACFATLYAASVSPSRVHVKLPPAPNAAATDAPPPAPMPTTDVDVSAMPAAALPPPPDERVLENRLRNVVAHETGGTLLDIAESSRGLVLSLAETGSFPAGRADLTPSARAVLLTVADAIRRLPNLIRVEGHTDDTPIHTPLFASNWELSTARATRVVEFLIDDGGVPPDRLSAAGYADYRPRVPNDSAGARARNRRVDIVILGTAAAEIEEPGGARP